MRDQLVASLLVAPAGAALLARLEAENRRDRTSFWDSPRQVDPAAVEAAIASLPTRTDGNLLAVAVDAAQRIAGPWSANAEVEVAYALKHAPQRAELAAAVIDRLDDRLIAPLDMSHQEWWWSNHPFTDAWMAPLGAHRRPCHAWVTATHDGLWTVTAPEDELADELVDAWELIGPPTTRWHLSVDPGVRVFEVFGPTDWSGSSRRIPWQELTVPIAVGRFRV